MSEKCVLYARVSTPEQHVETQLYDLRQLAAQRGFEVVAEYTDCGISGTSARRRKFNIVLVAAFDRVARSVKHFLTVMDELHSLGIEFVSRRENIDTTGAVGRVFVTLISAIAELEADVIKERIRAGMRRRKLEGFKLGRQPLDVNHEAPLSRPRVWYVAYHCRQKVRRQPSHISPVGA